MKIYKILFLILFMTVAVIAYSPIHAIENENIDQTEYEGVIDNYKGFKSCGAIDGKSDIITGIPPSIPKVVSIIYLVIQIAVPIVLVVLGSLDLFKGIYAQKDEEIRKGQQVFVKRIIAAAIVFFVFMIVKLFIGFAADSNSNQIVKCVECFIENKCNNTPISNSGTNNSSNNGTTNNTNSNGMKKATTNKGLRLAEKPSSNNELRTISKPSSNSLKEFADAVFSLKDSLLKAAISASKQKKTTSTTSSSSSSGPAASVNNENGLETVTVGNKKYKVYCQGNYSSQYGSIPSAGCSVSSMAIVLTGYGKNVTPTDVASKSYAVTLSLEQIASGLKGYGLSATASSTYGGAKSIRDTAKTKIDANLKSGKPVIILVRANIDGKYTGGAHYMALLGYKNGNPIIGDPAHGGKVWNEDSLDTLINKYIYTGSSYEEGYVLID